MVTARLFNLGNSQAVRIPARYRIDAQEVEIFERNGELVLRPKAPTAAALFERIRSRGADYSDWKRPPQGRNKPAPSFD
jgi:antitoxin VapB